jgi:hypothetical protein
VALALDADDPRPERRAVADLVVSNDGDELDLAVAADRVVAALGAWV